MIFVKSLFILFFSCFIFNVNPLPVFLRGKLLRNIFRPEEFSNENIVKTQWFTQRLDHFDLTEIRTWKQRYFINAQFYTRAGGPIFLLIGGEGPLNPAWMTNGQWCAVYGKKYHALCISLEHRYYGESHPTIDLSVSNLKYLSSRQALADVANFQTFVNSKLNQNTSKWITFGGSYPGSLSAWYRLKYPHLVSGAVSSSAPLTAVLDFKQFMEVVQSSILIMSGPKCVNSLSRLTDVISKKIQTDKGRQILKESLLLCDDINIEDQLSVMNLYSVLASNIAGVIQYNRDNRAFEGALGTELTIEGMCHYFKGCSNSNLLKCYSRFVSVFLKSFKQTCLDFSYNSLVSELRKTNWKSEASEGGRQWMYQTCAEFGFFQSSSSLKQPFGDQFPVTLFEQQCIDIFGKDFNATLTSSAIKQINEAYGGLNIKTSNTFFVNGNIDPWHDLGLSSYSGPLSKAVLLNGTAHCANMYPDSYNDTFQVKKARQITIEMIRMWLQDDVA